MDGIEIKINGVNLIELLKKIENLATQLNNITLQQPCNQKIEKLLTRKEVAELFGVSLVTLNDWTKKRIIKSYRIGNRVRFKETEINNALKQIN